MTYKYFIELNTANKKMFKRTGQVPIYIIRIYEIIHSNFGPLDDDLEYYHDNEYKLSEKMCKEANRYVRPLSVVLQDIQMGRGYITNPSKLRNWKGFER